jgi:hypothetical protein
MPRCHRPTLRLPQGRQLCGRGFSRTASIRVANSNNDSNDSSLDPTPSQLLRFSLTGHTQQTQTASQSNLDKLLEARLLPWTLDGLHRRSHAYRDETTFYAELKNVSNLHEFQLFFERNVIPRHEPRQLLRLVLKQALVNCQQSHSSREILSALNALISRLEKLEIQVPPYFHVEGMRYAAQCFSTPALEHHLKGFRRLTSDTMKAEDALDIVRTLFFSLRTICFADPAYDSSLMLGLVAGEGPHARSFSHKLSDILRFKPGFYSPYPRFLREIQATESLKATWKSLAQELTPDCRTKILDDAYQCVLTYIDAGMTEFVTDCLKDLSSKVGDSRPSVQMLGRLVSALAENELQAPAAVLSGQQGVEALDLQLRHIERRLGLEWQETSSHHSSIDHPLLPATDCPLLSPDGETIGFESVQRLVAEINVLGGSRSRSDLGVIADLLDEHDGSEVPLFTLNRGTESWEFAWFPQRSPIEFSNGLIPSTSDMSMPWSPATLGLLRARLDSRGLPVRFERTRHLMQLGSLAKRPAHVSKQSEDWTDTGYLVAFDRVRSEFVLVFIGKGPGVVDPGLQYSSLEPYPELCSIATLEMPEKPRDFKPRVEDIVSRHWEAGARARYHFDLDPGLDIIS